MFSSVMVATVTYGKRWDYLSQLIARLNSMKNIDRLLIFNNGSSYSVEGKVGLDFPHLRMQLEVVNSDTNLGSAGGYNRLLAECQKYKENSEYVLLLDDDNLPDANIFSKLESDTVGPNMMSEKNVISFYRQRYDDQLFSANYIWTREKYFNTYCKFSIGNKIFSRKNTYQNSHSHFIQIPYTQYSGMFFPVSLLDVVGLPNKDYYLYVDDTEFSYRITLAGYKILAFDDGKITDLENSWSQVEDQKEVNPHKSIFTGNSKRGLYYIRNRVHFEMQYLVKNRFEYNLNLFVYYFFVFILFMPKNPNGLLIFKKMLSAVRDGKKGNLGELHE